MRIACSYLPGHRDLLSRNSRLRRLPHRAFLTPLRYQFQIPASSYDSVVTGIRCFSDTLVAWSPKQDGPRPISTSADHRPRRRPPAPLRPVEWAAKFDKYLPPTIERVFPADDTNCDPTITPQLDISGIWRIVERASKRAANFQIFQWMIENGYEKPAIWIISESLKKISQNTRKNIAQPPSNITWPSIRLVTDAQKFPLLSPTRNFRPLEECYGSGQINPFLTHGGPGNALLTDIWSTLGHLVVTAADLDVTEAANLISGRLMTSVFLILGHLHRLNFMPDDIYAYKPILSSSAVQRPPILHLTSARILASLSDATWRDLLGDAVADASARGLSLDKILKTVPGSRFNVRVRDLGPEVWLELILWCCVETGQKKAAVSIIRALQARQKTPWFAIRWNASASDGSFSHSANIDWNRVKSRTGGTVGSIEGYSLEKPLIDIPPRTISVEVVLATIELCLNKCDLSSDLSASRPLSDTETIQSEVADLIHFLEPHDLPPEYFDYIGNRVMFATDFESTRSTTSLQKWAGHLHNMRQLETLKSKETSTPDLNLKSILSHSQHFAGVQQQALDKLVQRGDVHNSLQLFNDIQERIDRSKFDSIAEFLRTQPAPKQGFFSTRPLPNRLEYVDSYGQMPYHRLAAFLNLLSDNNMTGMGQWLLYSDEVDGAVIPPSVYRHSSMVPALLRFASVSEDKELHKVVLAAQTSNTRLPTVRYLRTGVNTSASTQDFSTVREFLKSLRPAEGGGAGLENIVYFAALLLRLEHNLVGPKQEQTENIRRTTTLLEEMLRGKWDSLAGTFATSTRKSFLQNIAHVLRMFAFARSQVLQTLAHSFVVRFPSGNLASLPTRLFNEFLSAMVDSYGAITGREMWSLFCGDVNASEFRELLESEVNETEEYLDDIEAQSEAQERSAFPEHHLITHEDMSAGINHLGEPTSASPTNQSVGARSKMSKAAMPGLNSSSTGSHHLPQVQALPKEPEINFDNPFFPESPSFDVTSYRLQPMVITRPNMQTVRIIVHAAVREKRNLVKAGLKTGEQDEILAWAYWIFKTVEAADDKMIEQELQHPLDNLSKKISRYVEGFGNRAKVLSEISSKEKTSPLWTFSPYI